MSEIVRCEKGSEKLRSQTILKFLALFFWEQMTKCNVSFYSGEPDRTGVEGEVVEGCFFA